VTTTEGMKGGGYYDDHSEYQRSVAATGATYIDECVAAIPMPPPEHAVVVVDYGASTGANSLASMRAAVSAVRARRADQPVAAVHNDLSTNDWNQLFANVASHPDSYTKHAGPVVPPLASAISFFEPAVPRGRPTSGCRSQPRTGCAPSRRSPCPKASTSARATGEARAALAAQADADWTTFLTAGHEPAQVLDDYFARLTARFTAHPEADAFEDWTLTVVLSRR
jgi:SAM dependent carboxyl methyltransferase